MSREDLIVLILALLILIGMVLTILLGGEKSRHGVGNTGLYPTGIFAQERFRILNNQVKVTT